MGSGSSGCNPHCYSDLVFVPPDPSYSMYYPRNCIILTTSSGYKIPSYYIPSRVETNVTIFYSHPNAADIGIMNDFLSLLHQNLNANIFHYEYVGYGLCKKNGNKLIKATERGVYESAEAGYNFLTTKKKVKPEDIIVFGSSIGTGPSVYVASTRKVRGLILESPFLSCIKVVLNKVPTFLYKTFDMFQNGERIKKVNCPVFIIHGTKDQVVPYEHGKKLWDNCPEEYRGKFVSIDNGHHNDIIEKLTPKTYIYHLRTFLRICDSHKRDSSKKEFESNKNNSNQDEISEKSDYGEDTDDDE